MATPPMPTDGLQLLDFIIEAATERGILIADGADEGELASAQKTVDRAQEELMRRISW
jgi:hypothetical protein